MSRTGIHGVVAERFRERLERLEVAIETRRSRIEITRALCKDIDLQIELHLARVERAKALLSRLDRFGPFDG